MSFHPNSSNNNTNDSPLPPPTASPQSPDRIDIPNEGESAAAATVVEIDGRVASNTNKLVDRVSQARELEDYSSGGGWSNNNSPPLEGGSPTPSGRSSFSLTVAGAAAKGLNSSSGAVVVDKVELIRNQHDQMEEELSHHHHLVESPLSSTKRLTPPWKRKKQVLPKTTHENEEDTNNKDTDAQTDVSGNNTNSDATLPLTTYSPELAVSATTTTTTGTTTTIGGEPRGGPAHDAELLALLKSVSNNSCSRFAADDETFLGVTDRAVSSMEKHPATTTTTEKPIAKRVPPWRKNTSNPPAASTDVANTQQQQQQQMDSVETVRVEGKKNNVIVVATSSPPDTSSPTHQPPIPSSSSPFSSFPATGTAFVGERGGAAEDAELLALLRGVSNQSSSASRFNDSATAATTVAETTLGTNKDGLLQSNGPDDPPVLVENKQRIVPLVPPWKRNAKPIATVHAVERRRDSTEANDKNVQPLAVTPVLESEQVSSVLPDRDSTARLGFKNSELPSTFQGERGGAAEDAELLALLRGVSNKSSAGRFSDDHNSSVDVEESKPDKAKQPVESKDGQANENSLPPWKRKLSQAVPVQAAKNEFVDNPVDDGNRIAPSRGIKSELTSTFRGDRGGSAEDAELLALLKGVSSKSSRDRFNDDFEDSNKATPKPFDMPLPKSQPPAPPVVASIENSDPTAVESETIPRENLSKALTDKNWKVRCSAYDTLTTTLKEMTMFAEALVDASNIFDGLDDLIPSFVEDGNAGALDKALELANLYADSCRGAGDSNRARKIVSSLVKKTALSSRPSTLKLSTSLALKLMEVGLDGQASVHSVVDLLLTDGISSKKPKVVQASASIIVEAAYHFGASSLPLASLCSVAPKWMSHSNALVRDCCIQVLAEICRALKSKAPIQGIVDTMKSAQVSELDSQLSKQPDATPVRTGLRSINLSNTASSPVDALAALEAGNKELESRRFAARSAVNLVAAVSKTDYAAQLSLPKWSEKVAALDKLIECGGERPFKLEQQTSSVNHGPLIADMKKLLSHTHFAVCSKAIQVLSMLAEGVGEKLYPQLRPSLTVLIQLSKDKKLTNAVSSGLDSLFGNVLSFENLLDSEDAIPSALDEKIQKNSIARSTALDFVRRCVERNCNAGPKGVLSLQSANKLAALCLCKLEDSDAAVRKVAQAVLELMQQSDNERIKDQTNAIIETLQISNPRVYKALSKSSEGIKEISSTRSNDPPKKPPSGRTTSAAVNRVAPAGVTAAVMESVSEVPISSNQNSHFIDRTIPRFEDALIHVSSLGIPQWDATEDDGGVLVGLRGK